MERVGRYQPAFPHLEDECINFMLYTLRKGFNPVYITLSSIMPFIYIFSSCSRFTASPLYIPIPSSEILLNGISGTVNFSL